MPRTLRSSFATLSAALLATTAMAGSARADQASGLAAGPAQPICRVNLGEDSAGVIKMPANAPALLMTDESTGGRATVTVDLFDTSTRIPLGAPKTDSNGLTILEIPAGTTGSFSMDVDADCGPAAESQPKDRKLVLDPATVALPTSVGSLSVRASSKPGPQENIVLQPSEGLRAFLPAAILEMSVGGRTATKVSTAGLTTGTSFVAKTGYVCVENGVLHREKRTVSVSVSAKIAGVAQLPTPATVDITVDCGAIEWTSGVNGGTTTPGDTTTTTPSGSTTTTTGGCAAAPSAPGTTPVGTAFAAIALGAVVVLVRRRRS